MVSREEFKKRRASGTCTIALIGMSGMGKTHWAQKLAEEGFAHMCCDEMIAERIAGLPSLHIHDLAAWMGKPYEDGYAEREREYLRLEEEVTREALSRDNGNKVVDTTGSVIYLPETLRAQLKEQSLVVYLQESPDRIAELFAEFVRNPKPVVWGDQFSQQEGESGEEALKRCYPSLLQFRSRQYAACADVTLPFSVARSSASVHNFLEEIVKRLPE